MFTACLSLSVSLCLPVCLCLPVSVCLSDCCIPVICQMRFLISMTDCLPCPAPQTCITHRRALRQRVIRYRERVHTKHLRKSTNHGSPHMGRRGCSSRVGCHRRTRLCSIHTKHTRRSVHQHLAHSDFLVHDILARAGVVYYTFKCRYTQMI